MEYTFGPESGLLLVRTTRTGLGAKAGHDLTIEVTRWQGRAEIDPGDAAACSLVVEADARSLTVREGTGGVKPLTDRDRADIGGNIRQKVLHTDRHPTIIFRSVRVAGTAESFQVEGDLTIAGVTQPLTVTGRMSDGRVQGSATVTQTRWGIKPYSAFFGALRLDDDVEVEFDVTLTPRP
ncbi:YceI family protein [Sphaerisporangium fuscum]|uniref:YceI family protein n=1 Tax=Sphaerisporangium fuscum TaxID=2835868 RepID=UPI001BDC9623|nr:YceI family protein [Sphaerisporangium fuscum]